MSQRKVKRFYREVSVEQGEGGFAVLLDGRRIRTPSQSAFALPAKALAEAVAEEWRTQGEHIDPHTMPLLRLTNTALERVTAQRDGVIEHLLDYARSDLLCYRADNAPVLAARHAAQWDPWLDWLAQAYGARLSITSGVIHTAQPDEAIAALRIALEARDDFALAGLSGAASLTGSLVLALALADGRLNAAEAFRLATLDEAFQAERWGEDAEAKARLDAHAHELAALEHFLRAVGG